MSLKHNQIAPCLAKKENNESSNEYKKRIKRMEYKTSQVTQSQKVAIVRVIRLGKKMVDGRT